MDGYAVRAEDVPAAPTTLKLVGRRRPAARTTRRWPGEAVRIFTGGPVPMGADSIVIQEDTEADGEKITVLEAPRPRPPHPQAPGSTSAPATRSSPPGRALDDARRGAGRRR